jgi:hypothetical protein
MDDADGIRDRDGLPRADLGARRLLPDLLRVGGDLRPGRRPALRHGRGADPGAGAGRGPRRRHSAAPRSGVPPGGRRGFRVVDEDAIAAGLGWSRAAGRDRLDLLEVARLANASERASDRVRAAVLFRIEGSVRDLAYTTRVELHLSGEIVDAASNRFLGAFDLPAETVSTAGRCVAYACASQAVAARAQDLATELGTVLAAKLAHLAPPERAGPLTAGPAAAALDGVYTLTLRHLDPGDAMAILDVMTDEFPGYRSHALIRRGTALRRYEYVTTTDPATLERWLTLLLVDMGLDPAAAVALSVRPGTIMIERVLPAGPAQAAGGG